MAARRKRNKSKSKPLSSNNSNVNSDNPHLAERNGATSADRESLSCRSAKRIKLSQVTEEEIDIKPVIVDNTVLSSDTLISVLDNERPRKTARRPNKMHLKSLISMDVIGLDILQEQLPSTLSALFGYLDSDELSRQFTYHCRLIPGRCQQTFKSFGNENKAKIAVEKHLQDHIEQLLIDSQDPEKSKIKFTAESIQAKQRRLQKESEIGKRQPVVKLERLGTNKTAEKGTSSSRSNQKKVSQTAATTTAGTTKSKSSPKLPKTEKKQSAPSAQVKLGGHRAVTRLRDQSKDKWMTSDLVVNVDVAGQQLDEPVGEKSTSSTVATMELNHSDMLTDTESLISKNKEIIEKITIQLQLSKQPYLDHSYPFFSKGKIPTHNTADEFDDTVNLTTTQKFYTLENKHEWDTPDCPSEQHDIIHHDLACHYGIVSSQLKTGLVISNDYSQVPFVQVVPIHHSQFNAPAVGEEVVIERTKPKTLTLNEYVNTGCIVDSDSSEDVEVTTTLARPYPPMPKYQPDLGTKLIIPEEEISLPMQDEDVPDVWDLENPDHVKKYAIRCMRELKISRGVGSRNCQVSCKICEKEFTAVATLMYHYRSHANIKPFVCLLCNATFTRQHSLNYHMLIHNGASRFKCPDCGRAFRHPSHYKEHQRRHTGEQPYKCPICEHRFKTRNSYKRHLLSRHPGQNVVIQKEKGGDAKVKSPIPLTDKQGKASLKIPVDKAVSSSKMVISQLEANDNSKAVLPVSADTTTNRLPMSADTTTNRGTEIQNNTTTVSIPVSSQIVKSTTANNQPTSLLSHSDGKPVVIQFGHTQDMLKQYACYAIIQTAEGIRQLAPINSKVKIVEKSVPSLVVVNKEVLASSNNSTQVVSKSCSDKESDATIDVPDDHDTSLLCLDERLPM